MDEVLQIRAAVLLIKYYYWCMELVIAFLQPVDEILLSGDNAVSGVMLEDGSEIRAGVVLSNATPKVTFLDLLPEVNGA